MLSFLWRILILVESLSLFGSVTNFMVPGTYKEFWKFESCLLSIAIFSWAVSIFLERREAILVSGSSTIHFADRTQTKILVLGLVLVSLLLVGHLI